MNLNGDLKIDWNNFIEPFIKKLYHPWYKLTWKSTNAESVKK